MNVLVTGGAGFIGRWVVDRLLKDGHHVWVLDNLSNGSMTNLRDMIHHPNFMGCVKGDITDQKVLSRMFARSFDICYHLAASINVQDSIDDPRTTFNNDVVGTFNLLEQCRSHHVKMVFMSTCMVYDRARSERGINEAHGVKPSSPYAGAKLAAEHMVLSYYNAYGLPVTVIRPFNTYGPFQKTSGEGGVVSIFIKNKLASEAIQIYGHGHQTRDLLYVEDCARFVAACGYSNKVNGELLNAGLGQDVSINHLAEIISEGEIDIRHITHIHPQSEIPKLLCDYSKAQQLLDWEPKYSLKEGMEKTEAWIRSTERL